MKREIKQRELGGWAHLHWELEKIQIMDILQARMIQQSVDAIDSAFVQITIEFISQQRFAAYDSNQALVAGDPSTSLRVSDCWVFERALKQPGARWRLAGRITL